MCAYMCAYMFALHIPSYMCEFRYSTHTYTHEHIRARTQTHTHTYTHKRTHTQGEVFSDIEINEAFSIFNFNETGTFGALEIRQVCVCVCVCV